MSRENVEIVRRCYELFAKGDVEGMLDYVDRGVAISEPREVPGAQDFQGHAGFREAIDHWAGEFDDFRVEIERLIEAGDVVIALVHQWGRGKASGVAVEIRVANVFRLKDGKVTGWRMYAELDEALEAVGLVE